MINDSIFPGPIYCGYGDAIARSSYTPHGFTTVLGLKDLMLAIDAAADAGTTCPAARSCERVQRPVARDTGLLPPLHLADIGQRHGPVLADQQVTCLREYRGDRGEQVAVAERSAVQAQVAVGGVRANTLVSSFLAFRNASRSAALGLPATEASRWAASSRASPAAAARSPSPGDGGESKSTAASAT